MAAKIKYDVTDVEDFTPYDGPEPKRGIYTAQVVSVEWGASKAGTDMFTIMTRISDKGKGKAYAGWPGWYYAVLGELTEQYQQRRMRELVKAFGLKEKGTIDGPALAAKWTKAQPDIRVVIGYEADQAGEPAARIKNILPAKDEDEDEYIEAADDDDEAEDEADEEDEEDEEDEDEYDEDARREELGEMERPDLRSIAKGLGVRVVKSMSDEDIIDAIVEAEQEAEPEDDKAPF